MDYQLKDHLCSVASEMAAQEEKLDAVKHKRSGLIAEARAKGHTHREIADQLGLSPQRVGQIEVVTASPAVGPLQTMTSGRLGGSPADQTTHPCTQVDAKMS